MPPRRKATPNTVRAARPEVLAFIQAIRDNPQDETTRLVLADSKPGPNPAQYRAGQVAPAREAFHRQWN
jgi:hypothetical protein